MRQCSYSNFPSFFFFFCCCGVRSDCLARVSMYQFIYDQKAAEGLESNGLYRIKWFTRGIIKRGRGRARIRIVPSNLFEKGSPVEEIEHICRIYKSTNSIYFSNTTRCLQFPWNAVLLLGGQLPFIATPRKVPFCPMTNSIRFSLRTCFEKFWPVSVAPAEADVRRLRGQARRYAGCRPVLSVRETYCVEKLIQLSSCTYHWPSFGLDLLFLLSACSCESSRRLPMWNLSACSCESSRRLPMWNSENGRLLPVSASCLTTSNLDSLSSREKSLILG